MCMFFFFFLTDEYSKRIIILFEKREIFLIRWGLQFGMCICSLIRWSRPTVFNIFTKVLQNVIWKLKTDIDEFSKYSVQTP